MKTIDLQGHRGARALKPENTLPAFEAALDLGATTIETDIHLTREGLPILIHDAAINPQLCRRLPGSTVPDPASQPVVSSLTFAQLRSYRADVNPDPKRFPDQDATVTPLAKLYAERVRMDPFGLPLLADLFAFADAYAGELGARAGKTDEQRQHACQIRFDLELKRVPFYPHLIGDAFDGSAPGRLEEQVVSQIREANGVERTVVRSFDHRSVRVVRLLEPRLTTAILVAETRPIDPAQLVRQAEAQIYCPDYRFLDQKQVRQLHDDGIRVVPWTANKPSHWQPLLDWGVDGITTDYPDRLAAFLRERGIVF